MTTVLLVRHAPTPETGFRLTGRLPGVHLHHHGTAIAEKAGRFISEYKPSFIYTSPIERTVDTAHSIGLACGLKPETHLGLTEIDFGDWSGRTLRQLNRLKAWKQVQQTPSQFRFPGGESFREAQHRSVGATLELSEQHPNRTIVLVSHADVIKLVLAHFLGQPLDLMQRMIISPASTSVVEVGRGIPPVVAGINLGVNLNGKGAKA